MNTNTISEESKKALKAIEANRKNIETFPEIKLLSGKTLSELLEINIDTIHLWVREGKFPKPDIKSNRFSRWKYTTIKKWIDTIT